MTNQRITQAMRYDIAKRVMAKVPEVDYDEKITRLLTDFAVSLLPAEVRALWYAAELRGYVKVAIQWTFYMAEAEATTDETPFFSYSIALPGDPIKLPSDLFKKVDDLVKKDAEQSSERHELECKILTHLETCKTVKTLTERFPDFAAYLPSNDVTSNLPASTDLMDSLKRAGWPAHAPAR